MFGIPDIGKMQVFSDPQKLALLTSGLALLAGSDPQRTLAALPNVMLSAARQKEAEKQRRLNAELLKQNISLAREKLKTYQQDRQYKLTIQQQMARELGIQLPGSIAPAAGAQQSAAPAPAPAIPQQAAAQAPSSPASVPPPASPPATAPAPAQPPSTPTQAPQQSAALPQQVSPAAKASMVRKAILSNMTPSQRLSYVTDPAFRRQVDTLILKQAVGQQKTASAKIVNLMGPDGTVRAFDLADPQQLLEARARIQQGWTKAPQKVIQQNAVSPIRKVETEAFAKDYQNTINSFSQVRSLSNVVGRIITSNAYQGTGEGFVTAAVKAIRDTTGLLKDYDVSTLKDKRRLRNALVLDALGGSLGRGITNEERRWIQEGFPDVGDSRVDLVRYLVTTQHIADANKQYVKFVQAAMQQGKSYLDAQAMWNDLLRKRDTGKQDEIPPQLRQFVPPRLTADLVNKKALAYMKAYGVEPSQDLMRKLTGLKKEADAEMKAQQKVSGQKKASPLVIKANSKEELFKTLKAKNPALTREIFEKAWQEGKIRPKGR